MKTYLNINTLIDTHWSDFWEADEGVITHHLLQGSTASKRAGEQREAVDE